MKTKERLIQFLDYKGIKPTKAENMLNRGKGAITKPSSISIDKLEEFLLLFTDLSAEWLMRGEGDMLKSNETEKVNSVSKKYGAEIEIDNEGYLKIKMKNNGL